MSTANEISDVLLLEQEMKGPRLTPYQLEKAAQTEPSVPPLVRIELVGCQDIYVKPQKVKLYQKR